MFVLRRLAAKHFTPRQDLLRTKKASFSSVDDALCTLSMCLCVVCVSGRKVQVFI